VDRSDCWRRPDEIARYLGKSPGRAIDWGIYFILAAVALGALAEISFSMRKGHPAERAAETR
jgi:hypothetical protein